MALQRSQGELRPAVLPPDEQPYSEAGRSAPLVARDSRGRITDAASARAMAKMPRGAVFVPRRIKCDARFAVHNRRRLEWLRRRRAELHDMTGGVSHAVGAMLSAAAWLYSAGEFAAERAAESGDLDGFKTAASLTATARTHDMGAWEMAVREQAARPPPVPSWMVPTDAAGDDDAQE